jgi:glycosyltransferase involved in cell wall biosynthesis
MKSKNVQVYRLTKNSGKGEAVRQGLLEAHRLFADSDWLGFWDADLSTPLDQVSYLIEFNRINKSHVHAVFGSRVLRLGANIYRYHLRHFLGRFFVTFSSLVLSTHVYDSQCGAKIFRREVVADIFADQFCSRWFFDLEIIQRMRLAKKDILECPLQTWTEIEGSKVRVVRDGIRAFFDVIRIRRKYGSIK